jgi:hypothetical protein
MKYEVSDLEKRLQTVIVMVFSSGKRKYATITTRRQDRCHAKPGHDITRYHQCWPRTDPIPRTNLLEEHRAMIGKE